MALETCAVPETSVVAGVYARTTGAVATGCAPGCASGMVRACVITGGEFTTRYWGAMYWPYGCGVVCTTLGRATGSVNMGAEQEWIGSLGQWQSPRRQL